MDRKKIANLVEEKAHEIVNCIKKELHNRLFSLKIDIASRLDRSVLGINAQFIDGDSLKIRTLAVAEFSRSHSSSNIRQKIIEVLSKFDLNANQVYSITTNNARNIVKAVKEFSSTADELCNDS